MRRVLLTIILLLTLTGLARAERLKDIVGIRGVRGNPIWGYGLVIGLKGTGDGSNISRQAMTSILRRSGITLQPDDISSKNIASVMVTAELGAFAGKGSKLDVTVSTIGSAKSLQGGTLLMTPLVGADGQTYAVAQGAISIGGFSAEGKNSSVQKNHDTVGRVPNGAIVEREEIADIIENGRVTLQLRNADFSTATEVAKVINRLYPKAANAENAGSIAIDLPEKINKKNVSAFIATIGQLQVTVDQPAVVVINEKTGTIIVGEQVKISTVAISHGNLSIVTREEKQVVQPEPFSETGETQVEENTDLRTIEEKGRMVVMPKQVSVSDLARALNAMGMTPRDLIAIFEALKKAGALQAELKVM
ncbi:MAG: flagellar basal body P-ring protein FlgI [Phycisphaerae bacterium]